MEIPTMPKTDRQRHKQYWAQAVHAIDTYLLHLFSVKTFLEEHHAEERVEQLDQLIEDALWIQVETLIIQQQLMQLPTNEFYKLLEDSELLEYYLTQVIETQAVPNELLDYLENRNIQLPE